VKYFNGVLVPDGRIFCGTQNSGNIGVIDTENKTFTSFGSGITISNGGVLSPNGCIYLIPYNNSTMCKVNVSTNAITSIGSTPGGTPYNFNTGILGMNGYIYMFPHVASIILKINPEDDTYSTFTGITYSRRCCMDRSGDIYYGTSNSNPMYKFNPFTGVQTALVNPGLVTFCLTYVDPGKIILSPNRYSGFISIYDITTNTLSPQIDLYPYTGISGSQYITPPMLLADGYYYSYANTTNKILKINPVNFEIEVILSDLPSKVANGYESMAIDAKGRGVLIPNSAPNVVVIDTGYRMPDNLKLPANLSDLPSSDFNIFYNRG
jgi:streptogramin lyase